MSDLRILLPDLNSTLLGRVDLGSLVKIHLNRLLRETGISELTRLFSLEYGADTLEQDEKSLADDFHAAALVSTSSFPPPTFFFKNDLTPLTASYESPRVQEAICAVGYGACLNAIFECT
jgi:hypothetical protein